MTRQSYADDKSLDSALAFRNAKASEDNLELAFESKAVTDRVRYRLMKYRMRHGPHDVFMFRVDDCTLRLTTEAADARGRIAAQEAAETARFACVWPTRRQRLASSGVLTTSGLALDFLIFVGSRYYTVDSFVEEAHRLGVSKRIANIPRGMILGASRVFLAAEGPKGQVRCPRCNGCGEELDLGLRGTGEKCVWCKGRGHTRQNIVFGYFIPSRIELIVRDAEADELRNEIADKQIDIVKASDARLESIRGCGHRHPGAIYAVSDPADWEALVEKAALIHRAADLGGGIAAFKRPVNYLGKHFLGIAHFDPASVGIEVEHPQVRAVGKIGVRLERTARR